MEPLFGKVDRRIGEAGMSLLTDSASFERISSSALTAVGGQMAPVGPRLDRHSYAESPAIIAKVNRSIAAS